jgi:hypothetical protein
MTVFDQQQEGTGVDLEALEEAAKWVAEVC